MGIERVGTLSGRYQVYRDPYFPPNQVLIAVALFLTLFIMSPTLSKINNESLSPYLSGDLTAENALLKASNTVKDFLVFNLNIVKSRWLIRYFLSDELLKQIYV